MHKTKHLQTRPGSFRSYPEIVCKPQSRAEAEVERQLLQACEAGQTSPQLIHARQRASVAYTKPSLEKALESFPGLRQNMEIANCFAGLRRKENQMLISCAGFCKEKEKNSRVRQKEEENRMFLSHANSSTGKLT